MATILEMATPVLGATTAEAEVQLTDEQARWALNKGLGAVKSGESTPNTTTDEPGPVFPADDLEIDPATDVEAGGAAVVIYGHNLTGATGATIGGAAVTTFAVVNSGKITGFAPAGTAGDVDVVVARPAGDLTLADGFTYTA